MTKFFSLIVSACLRGQNCRYDGKSKPDSNIAGNDEFNWIEICPERLAFGGEHEAVNRVNDVFVGRVSHQDYSREFRCGVTLAKKYIGGACGAVLKSKSPSCGYQTTPIYDSSGNQKQLGSGIWAQYLAELGLPIIDEHDFDDPTRRADFLSQCGQYNRENK